MGKGGFGRDLDPIDEEIRRAEREPEEVAKERLDRIARVLELKAPDRIPIGGIGGDVIPAYTGVTWYDLSYDLTDKTKNAIVKFLHDYPQDYPIVIAPYGLGAPFNFAFLDEITDPLQLNLIGWMYGPVHDIVKDKWTRWPGRELPPHIHPQFPGAEFMKPEEYKQFIEDPISFIYNVILPRALDIGKPGTRKWDAAWVKVGMVLQQIAEYIADLLNRIAKAGYPMALLTAMTLAITPTDWICDFLRHPTPMMLDLRRRPDEVKAAAERFIPYILKLAKAIIPPRPPFTLCFMACHLNSMLSPKMYAEFYHPYQKKIVEDLYHSGYKLFVFYEGDHRHNVDFLLEFPKGWGIAYFEKPADRPEDFIKGFWEKLKGHSTVMGGISPSMFMTTPEKIEEHVKKLLEAVKPECHFIIAPGVELPPGVPPQNLRAFINAALKYGRC